ncbi:MAG TPA: SRPBCC family protein [Gemmatimonadales bacterium]|nr:SRPBCC family protein [Gemmatimonadales bacterium]
MRTVDCTHIQAPFTRVFSIASSVARWPSILPHYRWVRVLGDGQVEMAAWRPFARGLIKYPTWWVSEMSIDRPAGEIQYRHVRGITRGMQVVWRVVEDGEGAEGGGGVNVEIVHTWDGPSWPLIGRLAANLIIGPVFIHGIASRTLAGIKRAAEDAEPRL